MQNPELQSKALRSSTKALEKSIIDKGKKNNYAFKLAESLKTKKTLQKPINSEFSQSPRSISNALQELSELKNSNKMFSKHRNRMSFFQQTMQSIFPKSSNFQQFSQSLKWNKEKQSLNQTLKKFDEILLQKVQVNNSPRKQTIPGAEEIFDSSKLMSITMTNFKTLEPSLMIGQKTQKIKMKISKSLNLPELYRVKEQNKQQKDNFYRMHPYLLKKQESKSLQRRMDKRKNLLGLEEFYLRIKNNQTKKIYIKK